MKLVKDDLQTLKDATVDVARLVVDQGDELSVGARRTNRAKMAVEVGTRDLKVARKYKSKSRKKCYWMTCLIVTLLLLGGGVAFVFLYNDGEYWVKLKNWLGI